MCRGKGGTIRDKCRKSLHSPPLTNVSMCRKGSPWELSLVTEDSGCDSATRARRRHSGVVIMLSQVCRDRAVSRPRATHPESASSMGQARLGQVCPPGRLATETAGQTPVCGVLHFALFGPQYPMLGGGGPSSTDPLLSSFWGEAREGPQYLEGTQQFLVLVLVFGF